jgi:hypothetical protein
LNLKASLIGRLVMGRGSLSFKSIFILDYWWEIENPQIVKFRVYVFCKWNYKMILLIS